MMNGLQTCALLPSVPTHYFSMLVAFPSWGARSAVAQELAGQVERYQDLCAIVAELRAQRRRARRGLQPGTHMLRISETAYKALVHHSTLHRSSCILTPAALAEG